jgi:hypothetical protein
MMPDDWIDKDLLRPTDPSDARRSGPRGGVWLLVLVLAAAAAVAAYLAFGTWTSPEPETAAAIPAASPAQPARPLGGDPASVVLPPLDESDALVRELVEKLSLHPRIAAWLATDGLIRNYTVTVANVADGRSPAPLLPALRPSGTLQVVERGDGLYIDPQSFARYNGLAEAVASIDPGAAARLYATLKPRIEEAYGDLGNPEPLFDRTLERAIVHLLSTPIPDGQIAVEPTGIVYGYADERLEGLTPAQKQLLRMGPQNARAIQRSLREIALALGIPRDRLPPG